MSSILKIRTKTLFEHIATHQKKSSTLATSALIRYLSHQITGRSYKPSRYNCFVVLHPKPREIFSPSYSDRIVHHLLVDKIEPLTDKKLIFDSYANRNNKGTHKAINRLQNFIRRPGTNYFLQADIASFFPSIDKNILFGIFNKHIKKLVAEKQLSISEAQLLTFIAVKVIFQDVTKPTPLFTGNQHLIKFLPKNKSLFYQPPHRGLPIGSLTSQYFANLYLNELDQFVKHQLGVKNYIRYVDDFIILHNNPSQLFQWKNQIHDFLENTLKLQLHPKKIQIQKTTQGLNFLGYITTPSHQKVRTRSIKSFKKKLYFFNHLIDPVKYPVRDLPPENRLAKMYRKGLLNTPVPLKPTLLNTMLATINTYYGLLARAETKQLRLSIYENNLGRLKDFFEFKNKEKTVLKFRHDLSMDFWRSEFLV